MADRETIELLLRLKDEFSKELKSALKGSEAQTKKSGNAMRLVWTELNNAIGLAQKAVQALKGAYDFGREGAQLERFRDAGTRLANTMGQNMQQIVEAVQDASGSTLTELEAMESANTALLLGVARTPQQFEDLTKASVALGRAMGLDARRAIESVTVGIGRQSKLWLDNLGVVFDAEDAYREYAESLGKTIDELTDFEKKQAFANQVLKAAQPLLDENQELVSDNATAYEQFEAALGDAINRMKEEASQTLLPFVQAFADGFTHVNRFSDAMSIVGDQVTILAAEFDQFGRQMFQLADGTRVTEVEIIQMAEAIRQQRQAFEEADPHFRNAELVLGAIANREREIAEGAQIASLGFQDISLSGRAAFEELDKSIDRTIEGWIDDIEFFAAGGAELTILAGQIRQAFAEGDILPGDAVLQLERAQRLALEIKQEAGLISFEEAEKMAEEFGISLNDPVSSVDSIRNNLAALTAGDHIIDVTIKTTVTGEGSPFIGQQHGGPLAPFALVGEAGPELIIGGTVIPAHLTRQLMNLGLKPRGFQGGGFAFDPDTLRQITGSTMETQLFSAKSAVTKATVRAAQAASTGTTTVAPSTQQDVVQVVEQSIEAGQTAAKETVQAAIQLAIQQQSQNFQVQFERQDRRSQEQLNALERIEVVLRDQASENSLRDIMFETIPTSGF